MLVRTAAGVAGGVAAPSSAPSPPPPTTAACMRFPALYCAMKEPRLASSCSYSPSILTLKRFWAAGSLRSGVISSKDKASLGITRVLMCQMGERNDEKKTRSDHGRQSTPAFKDSYPQNADFPRYYSRKEKKPFPVPILELRRAARERVKNSKGKPKRPTPPPKNGMLVRSLIPVAYAVYNARITLINNLRRLMKVVPVLACKHCNEIHVAATGHPFRNCRGLHAERRNGQHDWTAATVEDVFVPIESFHLFDRLGRRITHEERFTTPRVPSIVELCVQAGVDLPHLPAKRRRKPVIRVARKEFIDANEDDLPDPEPDKFKRPIIEELPESELTPPNNTGETAALAQATVEAWETVRNGSERLMKRYPVRVCGYCPEVHVGPSGHKAQNCGAHKHQQRNGQHGWQTAVLDDMIPPRYVWHVPDTVSELKKELRNYYGQAPAVIELCMQSGAEIPERYKSTMRLDIGIPTSSREAEMVV